ncbi:MAG TPA: hypothetical protein VFQ94_03930 [Gallionella sp.]|nr:hypothetical protein [Gallionella sp.]
MQNEEPHNEYLDNIKEKILILLVQHERLEPAQISKLIGAGVQLALFHLEDLKKSNMVMDYPSAENPASWGIIQNGRAYLVHHGLLS